MSADDDVHGAVCEAFESGADFCWFAEAVEQLDADGVVAHALAEGAPVLLCEDGCGDEDGGLLTSSDCFECGADGDFCFTKSDVATDESVHGLGAFHVSLGIFDGSELVWGFGVAEGVFELPHPLGVWRMTDAFFDLALGLETE